ncbi:MAG: hypothetical protein HS111_34405 [Kofleriaceae bacterium]|nr:hypothetical protein [Kofleriaceae bacterium]MCL4225052.1 hypothetical protein [Myxococcales bacterium]
MTVAILLRRALARPQQSDEHEVLGPCERGALVAGLALGAALDLEVVAVAAGPARREDRVLAMALRAGASRAVRLGAESVDELDYLGLAEALAATVRTIGARVVTCGDRSVDERTGAVGPAVAELLDFAHLTGVTSIAVDGAADGPRLLCERAGDGQRQRLRVKLPVVLCVGPPRAADAIGASGDGDGNGGGNGNGNGNGGRPRRARTASQAIDALDPDDVGLDLRQLSPRRQIAGRLRAVRAGHQATILPGAEALVERLVAEALVRRGSS